MSMPVLLEVKKPIVLKSMIIHLFFTPTKEINMYFLVKWAFYF